MPRRQPQSAQKPKQLSKTRLIEAAPYGLHKSCPLNETESKKHHPSLKLNEKCKTKITTTHSTFVICILGDCGSKSLLCKQRLIKASNYRRHLKDNHNEDPNVDYNKCMLIFSHCTVKDQYYYDKEYLLLKILNENQCKYIKPRRDENINSDAPLEYGETITVTSAEEETNKAWRVVWMSMLFVAHLVCYTDFGSAFDDPLSFYNQKVKNKFVGSNTYKYEQHQSNTIDQALNMSKICELTDLYCVFQFSQDLWATKLSEYDEYFNLNFTLKLYYDDLLKYKFKDAGLFTFDYEYDNPTDDDYSVESEQKESEYYEEGSESTSFVYSDLNESSDAYKPGSDEEEESDEYNENINAHELAEYNENKQNENNNNNENDANERENEAEEKMGVDSILYYCDEDCSNDKIYHCVGCDDDICCQHLNEYLLPRLVQHNLPIIVPISNERKQTNCRFVSTNTIPKMDTNKIRKAYANYDLRLIDSLFDD